MEWAESPGNLLPAAGEADGCEVSGYEMKVLTQGSRKPGVILAAGPHHARRQDGWHSLPQVWHSPSGAEQGQLPEQASPHYLNKAQLTY